MLKKYLGIFLSLLLFGLLFVQIGIVNAQQGDEPITGPLTDPITSPLDSPTVTPTPTLIDTISTTPIPADTTTPTPTDVLTPTATPLPTDTDTPTPSATPSQTPTPTGDVLVSQLGGLNLEGYCLSLNMPWDVIVNGSWYCANGASAVDMVAACQWQYGVSDVTAVQTRQDDVYSWVCNTASSSGSEPTATPTPTDEISPTLTVTQTPSVTPTIQETVTPTQSQHHKSNHDDFIRGAFTSLSRFFKHQDSKRGDADDLNTHSCKKGDHNRHETYYHTPRG